MSNQARDYKITALAQERVPPREIAIRLDLSESTVYGVLKKARAGGIDIPSFAGKAAPSPAGSRLQFGGRSLQPQASLRRPEHARPRIDEEEAPRVHWTEADDEQLRDLARGGVPLTRMAAFLRKPYRVVIEAAERLQLMRAAS